MNLFPHRLQNQLKMLYWYFIPLLLSSSLANVNLSHRFEFLRDFVNHQGRPAHVVSFLKLQPHTNVALSKSLSANNVFFDVKNELIPRENKIVECHTRASCDIHEILNLTNPDYDHVVYLANLEAKESIEILISAEKQKLLINPARWVLFYNIDDGFNSSGSPEDHNYDRYYIEIGKEEVENRTAEVYIALNTEVYVVFEKEHFSYVFLVYQRSRTSPLVWEEYGVWVKSAGFDRPHPLTALAMRRRDLQGSSVHSACVLFDNNSFSHMADYLYRDVDTLTKVMYYMSLHLFEWMNGTGHISTTKSWGYLKPDGTYDGTVREMWDGRSDFSGSVLIPMKERMPAVEYILPPSPLDLHFIFRKPSLASVANIYSLPFSLGVWISIVVLILISSMAFFFTSFREVDLAQRSGMTIAQRVSEGLHDTLCLVFQQGTAVDPISVSSRQILLLGLLAFMFLFTAYSANVVALLQSATNEINSVEALLNSPLQCGAQDVVYNREIFTHENRPIHRALWLKKGVPQGEQFFLSVEEGVRRVREGMYAFHVEPTAGYDRIKKTFLEHEKCNMGTVKYTAFLYPYVGVAKNSHIKEALRVGVIRILESGVQSRTTRRIVSGKPHCGAGAAMFTAVRLLDVAPAFKCMSALYAVAIAILLLEVIVHRTEKRRRLLLRNMSAVTSIEVD